jgi:hypothetical protein
MSHNNRSGEKGTAAETVVMAFLRDNGYPTAERRRLAGRNDRGDVAGIPGLVIEIKNRQEMALAEWVDEAREEALRNGGSGEFDSGVVWHKRRGKSSPGDWYVTMDGWTFLAFLKEWTNG